jgi:hypothetical protein
MIRWGLLLCSLVLTTQVFAQESTTSLSAAQNPAASAVQTSTSSTPAVSNPWHLSLGSETYLYEMAQRSYGSKAPAVSYNYIGGRYDVNKIWAVELRQQFQIVSSTENLSGRDKVLNREAFAPAETMLRIAAKPTWTIGSSKPIAAELRYYAPTDHVSQTNRELGRLRLDSYVEWMMDSKWSLATWVSSRVLLNSANNPNEHTGSDAEYYQFKAAPYLTYNINDNIAPYYAYTFAGKSSQAQRGNWTPDMGNIGAHELGLNLYYGAFYINPSLISETNLNNGAGSLGTKDSRAFAYENISYNFNIYANF